jgi:two-component system sensor histidine kinase MtrB
MSSLRFNPWKSSYATRITSAVIVISIITGIPTGIFLKRNIENGILKEQLRNALSSAQQIKSYADLQFILSQIERQPSAIQILNSLTSSPAENSTSFNQPVVLLPFPGNANSRYASSSPGFAITNVPAKIRAAVEKKNNVQWSETIIKQVDGSKVPAYVVGTRLSAANLGKFEIYFFYTLNEQVRIFSLIDRSLWIASFALVFLIGLTTTLISRRIVKPIRVAAEIADNFTSGKKTELMLVSGDDEMTRLAIAFNGMATSISQQINRLENLSALQQRFVSDVSHELRTPLTTIKMASQVINSEKEGFSPTVARSAELLASQIERFENLLVDLLELSRFDANAAAIEQRKFDLIQTLERTVDYISGGDNSFIKYKFPANPVIVEADERRVERILRNLITNAFDHRNGFSIEITVAENESAVAVGVRDFGIGFPNKDSERVFERFWRADPARARHRGGTGLGLAISREDATLQGGTLEAWGRPYRGAHFVLTLPKSISIPFDSSPIALIPSGELSKIDGIDEDPDQ